MKPANLLLAGPASSPVLKVADFGLAKNFKLAGMSGVTDGPPPRTPRRVTRTRRPSARRS